MKHLGKSIAVLPFVDVNSDSTQEYFSDGMTESIITELAQVPGLLVIARNSSFQYQGKTTNPVLGMNSMCVIFLKAIYNAQEILFG